MIRLIYVSSAIKEWDTEALLQLLKVCRKNNSEKDITGILLYSQQTFLQVLEGEEKNVTEAYSTIQKDPRHTNVRVIETEQITERSFPYWSMGFEKVDSRTLQKVAGLNNFFEKDFTPQDFASHKHILAPLMAYLRANLIKQVTTSSHEELPAEHEDPFIQFLHRTIRIGVKFLAMMMVFVMILGGADVVYVIYQRIISPPFFLLTINDMLATFSAFLAVLIAIEIFLNITLYIRRDIVPVKLVVATALMAISRKVIVFDFKDISPEYVTASAWVVIALGITYWLIHKQDEH